VSLLLEAQRVESRRERILPTPYNAAGIEKYGEPFIIAERIKVAMRRRYRREQIAAQIRREDRDVQNERAHQFWSEYEQINREHLPEDPTYSVAETGVTLVAAGGNDMVTLTIATTAWARVVESYIGGESGSSTVLRLVVLRSGTGPTGGSAATPSKFSPFSAAATTTANIGTTGGVVSVGIGLITHTFNTFGGTDRWVADPNHEVYYGGAVANGAQLSWRALSGTPVVSAHQIFEEL
jgi:hypothetical protein